MKVDNLPLVCWLLLAALNSALAQDTPKYFTDGGELTLDLRPRPPEPLGDVLWKIDGNLLAEWVKDIVPVTYYRNFIGRTTLDITTGRLVIKDMTEAEKGVYSAEVNRKVQNEHYNAVLIQEVPQPEVEPRPLTCSPASDSCTLSCEAAITEPAGPVTYSWKEGDGEWKESGKDLNITKSGTLDVETFTCRIQNPVSDRDSKPQKKPGRSVNGCLCPAHISYSTDSRKHFFSLV
uniref:Ig-like domain-containing protein n=1 Tax=Sander lucioperca TaxID=283035 RepID=A0A8D0D5X5_SANLU